MRKQFQIHRPKGPIVFIDIREFVVDCSGHYADEVGLMMSRMFSAVKSLPKSTVLSNYPFIRKIVYTTPQREHIPLAHRKIILARGSCVHCGSREQLTVDHITPLCRGGINALENYQCLCWPCNRKKWMRLECEI